LTSDIESSERRRIARRARVRWALVAAALVALAVAGAWFLQATIPRRIVFASGVPDGLYHELALRYRAILARDGVTVEERSTSGAEENERLLRDPASGVDVAFMQGGVVRPEDGGSLVMLASLYYEPLWVFYRGPGTLTQLDELRSRRVALGPPGSGMRALAETLLAASEVTAANSRIESMGSREAMRALRSGEVDAALLVASVQATMIQEALRDPDLRLMSLARADAYPRRYPYIRALTLPAGTVDLARGVPARDVRLIGTKAMLVARDGLAPPIIDLLLNAARELHSQRGVFEADDEFPSTARVDVPVSAEAIRHLRFGPSLMHRYLPFFVATYLERLIILLVPLLVVLVPVFNFLPTFLGWRARSRIYRAYGELMLLERDVAQRTGVVPIARWLADLDRIEQTAQRIRTSTSHASEAYTLREHIDLVRRAALARASSATEGGT
jgi:TRAP-type uncharacterized transport system substrate-binding protein